MWKGIFLVAVLVVAAPAQAADIDKLLPNDCECVLTLNVGQLLESDLNKKHGLVKMQELLDSSEDIREILKSLGFNPLKDIHRITWASSNTGEADTRVRNLVVAPVMGFARSSVSPVGDAVLSSTT